MLAVSPPVPNIMLSAWLRLLLSSFSSTPRKPRSAPAASPSMSLASCRASMPSALSVRWKSALCAGAACSLPSRLLMAVAAISGGSPRLRKAVASPDVCCAVRPNCRPRPPVRCSTLTMSRSVAALLSPRALTLSASARTCGSVRPKMLPSLPTALPDSSALILKATDISEARRTNSGIRSPAMPSWPPASAICARPTAVTGSSAERSRMLRVICAKPSGVASTTLRTSAMAASKAMASRAARVKPATDAATPAS